MASAAGPAQAPSTPQRASGAVGEAALPVAQRGLLTVGVMVAMVMPVLDTTIANVALPHMQASLNATSDPVTWALTSYIVDAAIHTPLTGRPSHPIWPPSGRDGGRERVGQVVVSAMCAGRLKK